LIGDVGRVVVRAAGIVHGDDVPLGLGQGVLQADIHVARKGRQAALARGKIADDGGMAEASPDGGGADPGPGGGGADPRNVRRRKIFALRRKGVGFQHVDICSCPGPAAR